MTTILTINAISSLLATAGIGTWLLRRNQRHNRETMLRPAYVTTGAPRRHPHR